MLTRLHLENFKSFIGPADLEFRRINLIFGSNSSGKSSLIQSLLLLKQSINSKSVSCESSLVFRGTNDLGGITNLLPFHDEVLMLSVGLSCRPSISKSVRNEGSLATDDLQLRWRFSKASSGSASLRRVDLVDSHDLIPVVSYTRPDVGSSSDLLDGAVCSIHGDPSRGDSRCLRKYYEAICTDKPLIEASLARTLFGLQGYVRDDRRDALKKASAEREISFLQRRLNSYQEYSDREFFDDLDSFFERVALEYRGILPLRLRKMDEEDFVPLWDEFVYFRNAQTMSERSSTTLGPYDLTIKTGAELATELERLTYVGPLREFPLRSYLYEGRGQDELGASGANLGELLYQNSLALNELNRFALEMELGYQVYVQRSQDMAFEGLYSLRLVDTVSGANVGLPDVGFGVSQVLPILAQCAVGRDRTIVIEQPELHLNPRLQAMLGSILSSTSYEKNCQFIIETHSEHLLMRFQRLIRAQELSADDVRVFYVSKTKGGSHVIPLELSKSGDLLDGWPDGFFDDAIREIF